MARAAIPVLTQIFLAAALVSGCAGGDGGAPALTLPEMPKMPDLSAVSLQRFVFESVYQAAVATNTGRKSFCGTGDE